MSISYLVALLILISTVLTSTRVLVPLECAAVPYANTQPLLLEENNLDDSDHHSSSLSSESDSGFTYDSSTNQSDDDRSSISGSSPSSEDIDNSSEDEGDLGEVITFIGDIWDGLELEDLVNLPGTSPMCSS